MIDVLPFERRNFIHGSDQRPPRYSENTWVLWNICDRQPWPFADKQFDFVTCSHLLEDVRDPVWVCQELQRVARAGYIECPSRVLEQSRGVEHPLMCGYTHHRWLVDIAEDKLRFILKRHELHFRPEVWVTNLGPTQRIAPQYAHVVLEWQDGFDAYESTIPYAEPPMSEAARFAASARNLPHLTVSTGLSGLAALKRWIYWQRLKRYRANLG